MERLVKLKKRVSLLIFARSTAKMPFRQYSGLIKITSCQRRWNKHYAKRFCCPIDNPGCCSDLKLLGVVGALIQSDQNQAETPKTRK
jgi:hypothetical protein